MARARSPTDATPPHQETAASAHGYPLGRGYGHDYMRGGEVYGGYGYADRPEYTIRRGELRRLTDLPPGET